MASPGIFFIWISLISIFSTTPPLPRAVLNLNPMSVPIKLQLFTWMFFTPPLISLPITNPPWAEYTVELRMVTCCVGMPLFLPASSRPLFMQSASSPTSKNEFSIRTLVQLSRSMPSPFCANQGFFTLMSLTTMFSLISGCRHQAGEF